MSETLIPTQPADAAKIASPRQKRHGLIEDWRDALGILLLLLVAAVLGAILSRFWPESESPTTTASEEIEPRLAAMEARIERTASSEATVAKEKIAKLEARIATLEQTLNAFGATPTNSGNPALSFPLLETAKRVDDVATRLSSLETKTATTPDDVLAAKTAIETLTGTATKLTTSVDGLSSRLEKLESSDLLELARRASLATAIANLTRAAQSSSPFKTEYDVVVALLPGETKLQQLAPHASTGLPTVGTLISTYANSADLALDAERLAKGGDGWTKLWANFSSLISWRSTNEQSGSSTESKLARAGIRLKSGDLTAAVNELESIKGAARKPLNPWLKQASARVKIEAALAALNSQAIEAITGPADSAEPVPQLPAP